MQLSNGKAFRVTAYITQQDIMNGGKLDFVMGAKPNKSWGIKPDVVPPVWGYI